MSYKIENAITAVPVVTLRTSIGEAIALMKEHQLLELPFVTNDIYEGMVFLEDIEHTDDTDTFININLVRTPILFTIKGKHILEAVKVMSAMELTCLPVLDEQMKYVGSATQQFLFKLISDMLGISLEGSIIVLRIQSINYSPAELARLVESNDLKLISLGTQVVGEGSTLEVTIKVDKEDIASLLSTFYRYEYEVIDYFSSIKNMDHYQDRYDQLMRYLEL